MHVTDLIIAKHPLPRTGRASEAIADDLVSLKGNDADWQNGRVPLFVFRGDSSAYEVGRAAFNEYFTENALGATRAFPSVKTMEQEVIGMALDLFHAPDGAAGFMSTGGSESIVLSVLACRNHARAQRHDPAHRGNIVAANSVHPAFDKAARMMDLQVRRVAVDPSFRADVGAIEAAIDSDTIMIVGSAPCFPFGTFDPIDALSELAQRRSVWLHVDACVGGYLAPFARSIGRKIPAFDFALSGVNSISADLHKYGYCPKPASTVLYRSAELAAYQPFDFDQWPNGKFVTPTIVGTRPAGAVAGAWATMNYLGWEGYERLAKELLDAIDHYKQSINAIDDLTVLGEPELSIVAFSGPTIDIFAVADAMQQRQWQPGLLQQPRAIHRMMSMLHVDSMDQYLADLRAVVKEVGDSAGGASQSSASYS